jgi:hypothetical protein
MAVLHSESLLLSIAVTLAITLRPSDSQLIAEWHDDCNVGGARSGSGRWWVERGVCSGPGVGNDSRRLAKAPQ